MKWSLKIGKLAGIDVFIHFTFFLLLAWIAFITYNQGGSVNAAVVGVVFILVIFACVVLHELGHALTAKKYGIKTRDIILLPIGGVARLEKMPDQPRQELLVALAGPAVNVIIAAIFAAYLYLTNSFTPSAELAAGSVSFAERIMAVNIFLVVFNLIPAFPMDGGRVLRALLATRLPYSKATQYAAPAWQGIAVLFGIVGLFYNPLLLFIAFFVWIGAAQEANLTQMKSALSGIPVSTAMLTDFKTLDRKQSLKSAVELTLAGSQKDFPVTDDGSVMGVLTQSDLIAALSKYGEHAPVSEAMQRHFITVDSYDMLETAFLKLKECNCHTIPVTRQNRLVGLLTMDNLGEYMRIQSALSN
ncbi:MAG: site-2 protease family protein [Desulfobacterales bacterium]|nr:site-2 protease family protein [Desulfobacterales bacterium]